MRAVYKDILNIMEMPHLSQLCSYILQFSVNASSFLMARQCQLSEFKCDMVMDARRMGHSFFKLLETFDIIQSVVSCVLRY